MTSELLVDCLTLLPNISSLSLDGRVFDTYVVSKLLWRLSSESSIEDSDNLLPSLESLSVTDCATDSRFVTAFSLMVHSRLLCHHITKLGIIPSRDTELMKSKKCGGPESALADINLLAGGFKFIDSDEDLAVYNALFYDPYLSYYRDRGILTLDVRDEFRLAIG